MQMAILCSIEENGALLRDFRGGLGRHLVHFRCKHVFTFYHLVAKAPRVLIKFVLGERLGVSLEGKAED